MQIHSSFTAWPHGGYINEKMCVYTCGCVHMCICLFAHIFAFILKCVKQFRRKSMLSDIKCSTDTEADCNIQHLTAYDSCLMQVECCWLLRFLIFNTLGSPGWPSWTASQVKEWNVKTFASVS